MVGYNNQEMETKIRSFVYYFMLCSRVSYMDYDQYRIIGISKYLIWRQIVYLIRTKLLNISWNVLIIFLFIKILIVKLFFLLFTLKFKYFLCKFKIIKLKLN